MGIEKDIEEHCPLLDERIENLRRANTAQNRHYVECDLKILSVLNPILYRRYLERIETTNLELYKQLNTTKR